MTNKLKFFCYGVVICILMAQVSFAQKVSIEIEEIKGVDSFIIKMNEERHILNLAYVMSCKEIKENKALCKRIERVLKKWLTGKERLFLEAVDQKGTPDKRKAGILWLRLKETELSMFYNDMLDELGLDIETLSIPIAKSGLFLNINLCLIDFGVTPYYTKLGKCKKYDTKFRNAEKRAIESRIGIWKTEKSRRKYLKLKDKWVGDG